MTPRIEDAEKLRSCPFCGGDNVKETSDDIESSFVQCFDCWAQGPGCGTRRNLPETGEVGREWNARTAAIANVLPTKPGPYWWRAKAGDEWDMVEVWVGHPFYRPRLMVRWLDGNHPTAEIGKMRDNPGQWVEIEKPGV